MRCCPFRNYGYLTYRYPPFRAAKEALHLQQGAVETMRKSLAARETQASHAQADSTLVTTLPATSAATTAGFVRAGRTAEIKPPSRYLCSV